MPRALTPRPAPGPGWPEAPARSLLGGRPPRSGGAVHPPRGRAGGKGGGDRLPRRTRRLRLPDRDGSNPAAASAASSPVASAAPAGDDARASPGAFREWRRDVGETRRVAVFQTASACSPQPPIDAERRIVPGAIPAIGLAVVMAGLVGAPRYRVRGDIANRAKPRGSQICAVSRHSAPARLRPWLASPRGDHRDVEDRPAPTRTPACLGEGGRAGNMQPAQHALAAAKAWFTARSAPVHLRATPARPTLA